MTATWQDPEMTPATLAPWMPTLIIIGHRYKNDETVELRFGTQGFAPEEVAVAMTVSYAESVANPQYHVGAVWTLTPGPRPPSCREVFAELDRVNNDPDRLPEPYRSRLDHCD